MMPTIKIEEAIKRGYEPHNIQTILFDKSKWDRATSTEWLKKHGYTTKYYRTTKNQIRRMQHNPVEGATYYSKRFPRKGIVIVFQNLPAMGSSILDAVKSVADRLSFKKRESGVLPPQSRALLDRIKDEVITNMVIVRTPIESYINYVLGAVSLGAWQNAVKSAGYDKLFHLSLYIQTKQSGIRGYTLHKIETTTLAKDNPIKADSDKMQVSLSQARLAGFGTITMGQLIEKTRQYMGAERFTNYHPATENCQDFIMAVLTANGLMRPEYQKFIKQDAVKIFEGTPKWTQHIAKFITDLGARANRLVQGEGSNSVGSQSEGSVGSQSEGANAKQYIREQKRIAKKLGWTNLHDIVESPRKNKKYRAIMKDGSYVDYGAIGMSDYLIHKDEARRMRFHQRFQNNKGYNDPTSGLFFSRYLLW
jgi:hypothetical protein